MVSIENVTKIFRTKHGDVLALDNINLKVNKNEFVVIRGPSGCGKTTLLLTLGGMLNTTSGNVFIDGDNIYKMSERKRSKFRAEKIGFVFQMFHLVPYLNVMDNVFLPTGTSKRIKTDRGKAKDLLKRLKLMNRDFHKPSQLSAGEIQRTAIARAMYVHPKVILADEPTGNLDPENATDVFGCLEEFHKNGGTVIVVTHGKVADQFADRIVHLQQGRIVKS